MKALLAGLLALFLSGCGFKAVGIYFVHEDPRYSFTYQWHTEGRDPDWQRPVLEPDETVIGVPTLFRRQEKPSFGD